MEIRSSHKLIKFPDRGFVSKEQLKSESGIAQYSIKFITDAGFTIIEDVPIANICLLSDTANHIARMPGRRETIMNSLFKVAKAYEEVYNSLGITILRWEVTANDPE